MHNKQTNKKIKKQSTYIYLKYIVPKKNNLAI